MNFSESFNIGFNGLISHKLRSLLTMLGIIFGVGAVISMLSIGEGAKQEALDNIALLGINNIIVQDFSGSDEETGTGRTNYSSGLSNGDAAAIHSILSNADLVVPQQQIAVDVWYKSTQAAAAVIGTSPDYDEIMNFYPVKGAFFNWDQFINNERVCVLGNDVKYDLFQYDDPIGKKIKLSGQTSSQWFTVVGVMEPKGIGSGKGPTLDVRNLNQDVYIPLTAANKRFHHGRFASEINQITIKIPNQDKIKEAAHIIDGIINLRHNAVPDYQIIVPEELLKQSQETQNIFNIVMGSIAGISLLVGGIGIMNIMLATVLERTREIGVRRAVGATKSDILWQFVIEAVVLSFSGGIVGIGIGYVLTFGITHYAEWNTIVSPTAIVLAFGVSVAVGLVFGIYPARKAAEVDPIESLRYE